MPALVRTCGRPMHDLTIGTGQQARYRTSGYILDRRALRRL